MYTDIQLKKSLVRYANRYSPTDGGRLNLLVAAARGHPQERRSGQRLLAFFQALIEAEQVPHGKLHGLAGHHQCGGMRAH